MILVRVVERNPRHVRVNVLTVRLHGGPSFCGQLVFLAHEWDDEIEPILAAVEAITVEDRP